MPVIKMNKDQMNKMMKKVFKIINSKMQIHQKAQVNINTVLNVMSCFNKKH